MPHCPVPSELFLLEDSRARDKVYWEIILQKIIACLEGSIIGGGDENASCSTPTTDEMIARWDEADCVLQDSLAKLDDFGFITTAHFIHRQSVPAGSIMNIIAGYASYWFSGFLVDGEIIVDGDFLEV